jgi:hypothetical protein
MKRSGEGVIGNPTVSANSNLIFYISGYFEPKICGKAKIFKPAGTSQRGGGTNLRGALNEGGRL